MVWGCKQQSEKLHRDGRHYLRQDNMITNILSHFSWTFKTYAEKKTGFLSGFYRFFRQINGFEGLYAKYRFFKILKVPLGGLHQFYNEKQHKLLFAALGDTAFSYGVCSSRRKFAPLGENLLLEEQFLSFMSWPLLRKRHKKRNSITAESEKVWSHLNIVYFKYFSSDWYITLYVGSKLCPPSSPTPTPSLL